MRNGMSECIVWWLFLASRQRLGWSGEWLLVGFAFGFGRGAFGEFGIVRFLIGDDCLGLFAGEAGGLFGADQLFAIRIFFVRHGERALS